MVRSHEAGALLRIPGAALRVRDAEGGKGPSAGQKEARIPRSGAGNREEAIPEESVCSIREIGPVYDRIPAHTRDHEQPPLD